MPSSISTFWGSGLNKGNEWQKTCQGYPDWGKIPELYWSVVGDNDLASHLPLGTQHVLLRLAAGGGTASSGVALA